MEEFELFIKLKTNMVELNDYVNYDQLIASFNFEVLLEESDNGYSGDTFILFKIDNYYGFLDFGWGSCSGCDALQGCGDDINRIKELREKLFQKIIWKMSLEEMKIYVSNEENIQWYDYSEAFEKFKKKLFDINIECTEINY